MNGIIVDGFLVQGSPYKNDEHMTDSCEHTLTGPFYFLNEEEKNKFVSNLTLTFDNHYLTLKIIEVNKP